jgi:hypothetical protein
MVTVCKVLIDDGGIWCPVEVATGETGYPPTNEVVTHCTHLKRGIFCPHYRYITDSRRIKTQSRFVKHLWQFW